MPEDSQSGETMAETTIHAPHKTKFTLAKSCKGQVSFEFVMLFVIVMFAFLVFLGIYSEFNTGASHNIQSDKAKLAASEIANAVNAILPSDKVSVSISISSGYNISSGVRSIIARDSNGFVGSAPILTDQVSINIPENASSVVIAKSGGMVYINGS